MTSFDDQLSQSSPPVPASSPELDAELARIVAETERLAHRPRRRSHRRLALGGLVVAGSLGAGAAAAASGILPWFDSPAAQGVLTTSTGTHCTLAFDVKEIEDPATVVPDGVRRRVSAAAEAFLEELDVSALSLARATEAAGPRATRDSEAGPAQTVTDYEVEAVFQLVVQQLETTLAHQELPTSSVGLSMASTCDGGDQ